MDSYLQRRLDALARDLRELNQRTDKLPARLAPPGRPAAAAIISLIIISSSSRPGFYQVSELTPTPGDIALTGSSAVNYLELYGSTSTILGIGINTMEVAGIGTGAGHILKVNQIVDSSFWKANADGTPIYLINAIAGVNCGDLP